MSVTPEQLTKFLVEKKPYRFYLYLQKSDRYDIFVLSPKDTRYYPRDSKNKTESIGINDFVTVLTNRFPEYEEFIIDPRSYSIISEQNISLVSDDEKFIRSFAFILCIPDAFSADLSAVKNRVVTLM